MVVPWYLMAKGKGGGGYKTASGPIVSVNDAQAAPLRSLLVNIDPVQAGSGDPSPDNVRPISGWSACNVWRTGKNLCGDVTIPQTAFNTNRVVNPVYLKAGQYTISFSGRSDVTAIYIRKGEAVTFAGNAYAIRYNANVFTFTADEDGYYYAQFYRGGTTPTWEDEPITHAWLELGSTATDYEPYPGNQYTIQLGQIVYGGTLDVTNGVLTVDRAMVDLGTLSWTKYDVAQGTLFRSGSSIPNVNIPYNSDDFICSNYKTVTPALRAVGTISCSIANKVDIIDDSFSDANAFQTAMSGVQLVYYLATPITIPLTPTQISTLQGENNLWADSGDVTVEYLASGGANADLMKLAVAFIGEGMK